MRDGAVDALRFALLVIAHRRIFEKGTATADGEGGNAFFENSATGEFIAYKGSDTLDGAVWGDGANGTVPVTAVGTGRSKISACMATWRRNARPRRATTAIR